MGPGLELVVRNTDRVLTLAPGQTIIAGRTVQCDLQIDDPSVSRRHCSLTSNGGVLQIKDLDSANGTFVSPAGEQLPTAPLDPGTRHELADDERVFIGGWTRLVVRLAVPGEV